MSTRQESPARRSRGRNAQGKRVTLREVARQAGVGQITASRALREPDKVSPALRERVQAAVDALGYVPNRVARGLASGASPVVAVVIPTLDHAVYVPFLRGARDVLEPEGYELLLGTTEYVPETEARLVDTLLGWFPSGLLLAGVDHLPATCARLRQAVKTGMPVVEFMDLAEAPLDMNVGFSHREVGSAVARHLAASGARRIAYAGTLARHDVRSARRIEGFRSALRALGLADELELRVEEAFSIALGGRLLAQLLERHPDVDAVFFANDDLAAGALFEAARRGIEVPGRLRLMGFNDMEIAAAVSPSISSVRVDQYRMGRISAQMLMRRLAGDASQAAVVDTGFALVGRGSTLAPEAIIGREEGFA